MPAKDTEREARLAAKLRENLRRRKAQGRALDGADLAGGDEAHDDADRALPKERPAG